MKPNTNEQTQIEHNNKYKHYTNNNQLTLNTNKTQN